MTTYRANGTPAFAHTFCQHDDRTAARLAGDPIASVWECDECGDQTPFDDAAFEFCGSQPWRAPWARGFMSLRREA